MPLTVLSLFAGVGGFDLGLERVGFDVISQVEFSPFCQRILAARFPRAARHGDISTFNPERRESSWVPDLLTGGFPCQDLSVAGKRAGLGGGRSGLFWQLIRVAKSLEPAWGLIENVPGLFSSHRGRDFWALLQGLRECWPAVGYRVLDSQHFGVAQRRRRVFLVCGPTEAGVAEVLAFTESGRSDFEEREQAWKESTAPPRGSVDLTHTLGIVADPLNSREGKTYTHEGKGNFRLRNVVFRKVHKAHDEDDHESWDEATHTDTLDPRNALTANAVVGADVRKFTPLECERLQGFPDGWTCLCQHLAAYVDDPDTAALRCRCDDTPRYRALGNAVTVPVIEALGLRLLSVMR